MHKDIGLSLVFCMGLCLTSASVRAGDPDDKAASPDQVKKSRVIVRIPDSYTLAVALTADGKLLARGGADNMVDLWDVASGKQVHRLTGHTVPILRLAFSPDSKTLASITGSWLPDEVRGEVKLWDVATGKERVALEGHPTRGLSLAFSPDGTTLASASTTVRLWDVGTGQETLELKLSRGSLPWSLAFSPDGKTLATGTGGGIMGVKPSSVILWEVATGKERAILTGHANSITWVGFAPDGKTLASASGPGANEDGEPLPGEIKLWDVIAAKERATIPIRLATPLQFFDLTFTVDNKSLTSATASFGETEDEGGLAVQHWDLATRKARTTFWAPINLQWNTNAGIFFTALSADGKTVAWGGAEEQDKKITGTAQVWEVQSLATSPPKPPNKAGKTPPKNLTEPAKGTFRLRMPASATFIKPGETKTAALGIQRGKNFDEDVKLTFTFTDVPKGVTFEPANLMIQHPGTEAEFTIQAANDATLGDFAIKVTGITAKGNSASDQFNLSVDPAGAVPARERSGKPAIRRQYLRRSRDPFTGTFDFSMAADESAHDGMVVSTAGGKLVMKSKDQEDANERTYTLAANPQISYNNAAGKLEDLRGRQKAVVICPASLRPMWQRELAAATIAAMVVGMEELGREEFDTAAIGDADCILIDESHNFRNGKSNRYLALDEAIHRRGGRGRDGQRKKIILLSATPINNDIYDLANQIGLFTQGEADYFRDAGIGDLTAYFRRARRLTLQSDASAGVVLFNLLEEIMVRNTRPYIRAAYANATINGRTVVFPDRRLHTVEYDLGSTCGGLYSEIVAAIDGLSLAPYQLETYRKESAIRDEKEVTVHPCQGMAVRWDGGRPAGLAGIRLGSRGILSLRFCALVPIPKG